MAHLSMTASEQHYGGNPVIHTIAGDFNIEKPVFNVRAIAHALAQTVRFNGHCWKPHSVAQHSVRVMDIMDYIDPSCNKAEGLLHDAVEAYMSDLPSPFKQLLPDWRAIDARLDQTMREQYQLPKTKTDACTEADWIALFIEADTLLPGGGKSFPDPHGLRGRALSMAKSMPYLRPTSVPWTQDFKNFEEAARFVGLWDE